MKPSKAQQEILDLMANGWELGLCHGLAPRYWLQKGGLGKGGEIKNIRSAVPCKLVDLGLIKGVREEYPFASFALSKPKGG